MWWQAGVHVVLGCIVVRCGELGCVCGYCGVFWCYWGAGVLCWWGVQGVAVCSCGVVCQVQQSAEAL